VLLVLFVVVLLTSLVTLSVDSGVGPRAREQAIRALRDTAAYAVDDAQFTGRDLGLLLQRRASAEPGVVLHWRERQPQGWRRPATVADVFAQLELDGEVSLILDGVEVVAADAAAADPLAGTAPQWLFTASGETQSGELLWRDADSGVLLWRLSWDALGRFELYPGDAVGDAVGDTVGEPLAATR
jgi:hypothetical protein